MKRISIICFTLICFFSCQTEQANTKTSSSAVQENQTTKASAPTADLPKNQKASASTAANLSMGYWHMGGAVNTTEGDFKYEGCWFKFNKEQTFVYGKDETDVSSGTWIFDENTEYITLKGEPSKPGYFLNEFKCRQIGDIILLTGNTPNNPRGTQIKLVRKDTKVIDHNPN